jgi:F-type H+-transporting ATPase subunit a
VTIAAEAIRAGSPVVLAESGGFHAPGPGIFDLPPVFEIGSVGVTKPMLLLLLSALLIFAFFYAAAKQRSMVPGKLQYAGEVSYGFVRNNLGRDIIGSRDFMRFMPYLAALFFFVLLNNLFASIPFIQFPTFSRAGTVYALAGLSWLIYNYVGIRKHGFLEILVQFLQAYVFALLNAMYISGALADEH